MMCFEDGGKGHEPKNAASSFSGLPWWLRQGRICLQYRRPRFDPWVKKIPWRRKWLPTPVFLPGESHGQRSLVGCSPQGHKESDTTEPLILSCRSWKGKEVDSPQSLQRECSPADALDFSSKDLFQASDLQNFKIINCCFKPPNCGNQFSKQETNPEDL